MWQNGGASLSHFLITPFNFNLRVSANIGYIHDYLFIYFKLS